MVSAAVSCPICGQPPDDRTRPFCSRRCADIDLNRWLSGVYAIPAADDEENGGISRAPEGTDDRK